MNHRQRRLSQLRIRLYFMLFSPDQDTGFRHWSDMLSLTVGYIGGHANMFSRN